MNAKERHEQGVKVLNHIFSFDPASPPKPRRKHAKHNGRWRLRKIVSASRKANRP